MAVIAAAANTVGAAAPAERGPLALSRFYHAVTALPPARPISVWDPGAPIDLPLPRWMPSSVSP